MTEPAETCPKCGDTDLLEVRCVGTGPHYARISCRKCQKHVRHLPAPWSFARAEAFAMPFGKHRGKTLGELSKSGQGRGYLRWLAESNYGNAQKAAEIVLRGALGEEQP